MNVSYRWLRELAPSIEDSAAELAERLTHVAVPVDAVSWLGEGLEELVVARVESVSRHPQADRLVVCQVDTGGGESVQVVTGAPVVVEGGYYPFVGAGQTLPDGTRIKRTKLRGVYSEGMLCSEKELGIGRDAAGIMQLHGSFEPGQPVVEALEMDDYRLDLDVTANRPDLLGHLGVARELAPGGVADLQLATFAGHVSAGLATEEARQEGRAGGVVVRIEDAEGCPRYMGAVIRGVTVGPSPEWLANRLRAIGQQPINNVVDATNYVLHELNQPLHAFDLEKLHGPAVVIRRAKEGERLRTLDDRDRKLDPEMLVIGDAEVATALAGLMGGSATEVTDETKDLFIECAYFDPKRIRKAARGLGLDTDASYRFQRGIDPLGLPVALERVVELILTVAGGAVDGKAIGVGPVPAERRTVGLRLERLSHLLGVDLDSETIRGCLEPIAFQLADVGDGVLQVTVPTWRPDVEREVDLIEEVARRHGYGAFPVEMRSFRPTTVSEDEYVGVVRRLRERLVGLGFLEARTAPFAPDREGEVRLLNPLSERENHLRRDLLTGLVHRIEYNFARGERDVRLFEIGTVFSPSSGPLPGECIRIAAACTGRRHPLHWSDPAADWDVWDLKWLAATVAEIAAPGAEMRPVESGPGPITMGLEGALAAVTADGQRLGWAGKVASAGLELPPWAAAIWGLEVQIVAGPAPSFEYRPLPVYPAVDRDIALVVAKPTRAAEVEAVIHETAPAFLEGVAIFDVYEGAGIPDGTRSIAWRLRFRAPGRTLTDQEVDAAMRRITSALEEKLNVRVRGT